MKNKSFISVEQVKKLGKNKSNENLIMLLELFKDKSLPCEIKREITSSIGRQKNIEKIREFIKSNIYTCKIMDIVYQMYRTCLYKGFDDLAEEIENYFNNEMIYKMKNFYKSRHTTSPSPPCKPITPLLLIGDNKITLHKLKEGVVNLIFTSPPYYNAREYSNYKSYTDYLEEIKKTFIECHRVLEDGRFIIVNVSPVITKRPGREFESIRYPIHYDYHKILTDAGYYFIDEIIWIKPEASCKNRNGGYQQTQMPLSYKPNCITESIMVYRKNANFLIDKNIKKYSKDLANNDNVDSSNCWYIEPRADKNHPAVFPPELCKRILKYYSFKGDVVLDPFAGSGTFGQVAQTMGRIPILCESNTDYVTIIKENIYGIVSE